MPPSEVITIEFHVSEEVPTLSFSMPNNEASPIQHIQIQRKLQKSSSVLSVLHAYVQANEASGGVINFYPDYAFLPVIIGNDNSLVPLYEFIEEVDGLLDYDEIKERFPSLSYGQIACALGFLRKLAQFNQKGLDIDALEESFIEADPAFQETVLQAMSDGGK